MGSKHKKNKAKKTQSKQTASSEAQVASGASGTEEAEENEPGRANQAASRYLGLRIEPFQRNSGSAREGCGAGDWVAAALHTYGAMILALLLVRKRTSCVPFAG